MAKRSVKPKKTATTKKKPVKKPAVKRTVKPKAKKRSKKSLANVSKPYLLAASAGIVLLLALFGVIFSQQAAAPNASQTVYERNNTSLPSFADVNPSRQGEVGRYRLLRGETPVLDKSEYDWRGFTRAGSWLFFHNLNLEKTDINSTTKPFMYDIHAYNTSTNQYVTVGSVEVPNANEVSELYQIGTQLYVYSGSYKGDEVTYRCEIDPDKACNELQVFYKGRGRVYRGGEKFYVMDSQADAGTAVATVYELSTSGERGRAIKSFEFNQNDGDYAVTIDANGFIWVYQEDKGTFVRLAALDESGLRIKQLEPAQIPIKNFFTYGWVDQDVILLSNDNESYLYDTINNTFEHIKALGQDKNAELERELITRKLSITTPFQLEYIPSPYSE